MNHKGKLRVAATDALSEARKAVEEYYMYLPMGYERDFAEEALKALREINYKYPTLNDGVEEYTGTTAPTSIGLTPVNCTSFRCPASGNCATYKKQEQTDTEMYADLYLKAKSTLIGKIRVTECDSYVDKHRKLRHGT